MLEELEKQTKELLMISETIKKSIDTNKKIINTFVGTIKDESLKSDITKMFELAQKGDIKAVELMQKGLIKKYKENAS